MNSEVAKQVIAARRAVKKKLQTLKSDVQQSQLRLQESYKPITETIKHLVTHVKSEPITPKHEKFEDWQISKPKQMKFKQKQSTPKKLAEIPSFIDDGDVFEGQPEETSPELEDPRIALHELTSTPAYKEYLEWYEDPLPRVYIDRLIRDVKGEFDHRTGIRYDDVASKFYIGDSEVHFEKADFKIKDITYKGTPGLYELLFKKNPIGQNKKDIENYNDILRRTNSLHRNYDPTQQIIGTKALKYKQIIQPSLSETPIMRRRLSSLPERMLKQKKIGFGLAKIWNNKRAEYIYWDDPNELVERLELLIRSQQAGNTGNNNEIVSIIEELRERKIII